MGIFNLFKRSVDSAPNNLTIDEKAFLIKINRIKSRNQTLSPDLYQQLRDMQAAWLERTYDFNTLSGINAIPETISLPGAPFESGAITSHTGEVYYYLRHKAYNYEESNQMELALACMKKSVALVRCRSVSFPDDYYPLVKMLARAGNLEEARKEKAAIDKMCGSKVYPDSIIDIEYQRGLEAKDFAWIQINLPHMCPKSISSFRRIKTQNTKNYQQLQKAAADLGRKI